MMKNILLTISSAALLLAACNTEKKEPLNTDKQVVFTDTSASKNVNASTDIPAAGTTAPVVAPTPQAAPPVQTITKIVKVYEKRPAPIKTPAAGPISPSEGTTPPATLPAATNPATTGGTEPANTGTATTAGSGTTPATTPEAKKKGGWSGAAKDATIGGVGGAVIGGVIGKGAKGAVIGGVIGAAGGYILGKKADKKKANVDTAGN